MSKISFFCWKCFNRFSYSKFHVEFFDSAIVLSLFCDNCTDNSWLAFHPKFLVFLLRVKEQERKRDPPLKKKLPLKIKVWKPFPNPLYSLNWWSVQEPHPQTEDMCNQDGQYWPPLSRWHGNRIRQEVAGVFKVNKQYVHTEVIQSLTGWLIWQQ